MNKMFLATVISLFLLASLAVSGANPGDNSSPEHKVIINLTDSKILYTGTKTDGEKSGSAKLTGGELVMDNTELKGGSFTVDINPGNNKDSRASFEIKKVTKLPVTRTEQGEIKFTHKIEGELTMKGQTKTISFDASVNILNGKVAASSQAFRIDNNASLQIELITE